MRSSKAQAIRGTAEEREYYSVSKRVYTVFAHVYDAVVFPFRNLRSEVVAVAALPPGSRVLDVATGTGAQAFAFAGTAKAIVGIDLSEAMLRVARRKNRFPNVTFQQADAAALPFDDGTFDAACISFALHEMPASIRERVVREMARVTRPGGAVIVVDYALPRRRALSSIAYQVVKLYEAESYPGFVTSDVAALLEPAGIDVRSRHPWLLGLVQIVSGRRGEAVSHRTPPFRDGGSAPERREGPR